MCFFIVLLLNIFNQKGASEPPTTVMMPARIYPQLCGIKLPNPSFWATRIKQAQI